MKRTFFLATSITSIAIGLLIWWWLSLPSIEPKVRGRALSSFDVPDHLDDSAFKQRLGDVGFVAANEVDFNAFLAREQHGNAIAPGSQETDLQFLQTFRHVGNTASMTRIIGYDARNRKVHYFRSQEYALEGSERQQPGDAFDFIEQELRK
ncbi:MAG: hypothetical protein U0905_02420 [Pirellulales bacterium]